MPNTFTEKILIFSRIRR